MFDSIPNLQSFKHTPTFFINNQALEYTIRDLNRLVIKCGITQFFPLKTNNFVTSLKTISKYVDGFATSSIFEARLAREIIGCERKVHFTSPGLRDNEIDELISLCDGISFNSLSQWDRFRGKAMGRLDCALRINPQLSFVKDKRYDPSRTHSRLGVQLSQVKQIMAEKPELLIGITGLHFHTNCDSESWVPILETIQRLDTKIPNLLTQCSWINLGGGYLFKENTDITPFYEAAELLQTKYGLQVIIEPGAAVVRDACFLVSRVIDIIPSDCKQIAVLDTTVNHMPEVFEYQFRPDILNESENGGFSYILEGSTCLAGDHFGEYSFDEPLKIGSTIVFSGVGAYTMVKAHTFNGINLPSVYSLTEAGELALQKQYTYQDFKNMCGADDTNESI